MKFVFTGIVISLFLAASQSHRTDYGDIQGVVIYDYYIDKSAAEEKLNQLKESRPELYAQFGENYRRSTQIQDDLKFKLEFNESQSIFYLDRQVEPTSADKLSYATAVILASKARESYYVDHKQKIRLSQGEIEGSSVNIVEEYQRHDWVLTGEEKTVEGRTLLKATTQRNIQKSAVGSGTSTVEVWYAPDIPVSFGPLGYDGLPGLIMELRFGPEFISGFSAVKLDIGTQEKPKEIGKPKAIAEINETDFIDKMEELRASRKRQND